MMRYGAKLRGTRVARRHELMDMIRAGTSPHAFFTLSAADLQWPNLNHHMPKTVEEPTNDPRLARQRRRIALHKKPHIAAAYLDQRLPSRVRCIFNTSWYLYWVLSIFGTDMNGKKGEAATYMFFCGSRMHQIRTISISIC